MYVNRLWAVSHNTNPRDRTRDKHSKTYLSIRLCAEKPVVVLMKRDFKESGGK